MKRSAILLAALCISLAGSGCATLLGGKYRTATIFTDRADSVAMISPAGIQPMDSSKTAHKFRVPRHEDDLKIRCTDGRQSIIFPLHKETGILWSVANIPIFPWGHLLDAATGASEVYPDVRVIFLPRDTSHIRGFNTPEFQKRLREVRSATEMTRLVREYRRETGTWIKVGVAAGIHALSIGVPLMYLGFSGKEGGEYFGAYTSGILLSPLVAGGAIAACGAANNERGHLGAAILGSWGGILAGVAVGTIIVGAGRAVGDQDRRISAITALVGYSLTAAAIGVEAYNETRPTLFAGYGGGTSGSILDIDAVQGIASVAPPAPRIGLLDGFDSPRPVVRFGLVQIRL